MHTFLFYVCISCCLKCTVYRIGYVCNIFPNELDEDCRLKRTGFPDNTYSSWRFRFMTWWLVSKAIAMTCLYV